MNAPRIMRRLSALAIVFGGFVPALHAVAQAVPPANDDVAAATPIATLPFAASTDLAGTTLEPGEPGSCAITGGSQWYRIEVSTRQVLRVGIQGPAFQVWADVYRDTGSGLAGLVPATGCIGPFSSPANVTATAGTYYVRISGNESPPFPPAQLSIEAIPPPANDDAAAATPIAALPFNATVDATGATVEPGESMPCAFSPPEHTVWYRYTAPTDGSITLSTMGATSGLAAYAGSADAGSRIGCAAFGPLTVRAQAGTTYLLQAAATTFFANGSLQVTLDVAPPPTAAFYSFPFDPAALDLIQFQSESYDPAGLAFTEHWDFGDATTFDGTSPQHRYARDGDYTVTLTVTAEDGRTATASQDVHVRTYDVAITKMQVPNSARNGQTRTIGVSISNHRYDVPVEVVFARSTRGGDFVTIGSVTQTIPTQTSNKATEVSIVYTFTADDAAAGKVTFRATAVTASRDAFPGDNIAISFPTRVDR